MTPFTPPPLHRNLRAGFSGHLRYIDFSKAWTVTESELIALAGDRERLLQCELNDIWILFGETLTCPTSKKCKHTLGDIRAYPGIKM